MKETFITSLPEILSAGAASDPDRFENSGCWTEEGGSPDETPSVCALPQQPRRQCHCAPCEVDGETFDLCDGSVVIAAITSCTNTSNPAVMVGAGLLARNAVARGLRSKPWVKTSLAPGSKVVTEYLEMMELTPHLEALGFHLVGYGCTTCIGNSGPLHDGIVKTIEEHKLVTAAVISGNRNYEARINPWVRANYLASPILVVAYAIAGTVEIDLATEPLCLDPNGEPVYLEELWPDEGEIQELIADVISPDIFEEEYVSVFDGSRQWSKLPVPEGKVYEWEEKSTYIREPPFFVDLPAKPAPLSDIKDARILAVFGDTLTTDHISPAGNIAEDGPAGRHLVERGVSPSDFNSFGSRRGNHEVMMRGTFANIRIRNQMMSDEGGSTVHQPSGDQMTIFEAAERYRLDEVPLVILGGGEYGAGSSRDWAAKGTVMLGVKAVIARSYERIHRSNLVGMGVLPLQFQEGESVESLGLTGSETLVITGIASGLTPGGLVAVRATPPTDDSVSFEVLVKLDSQEDLEYYQHGGILQKVLRELQGN